MLLTFIYEYGVFSYSVSLITRGIRETEIFLINLESFNSDL